MNRPGLGPIRWRNVPVPESHVGGLLVGGGLQLLRPWPLPLDALPARVLGGGLVAAGLLLVGAAVGAVGRQAVASPTKLVTGGPYRYSRNPMYVGWTGLYVGLALVAGAAWPMLLLPVVLVLTHRAVRREERVLADQFGAEYEAYREAVPRYR